MQDNKEGIQAPIAFMSIPLKNHEPKYSQIEKHAFAVVKALKNFRFLYLALTFYGLHTRCGSKNCVDTTRGRVQCKSMTSKSSLLS